MNYARLTQAPLALSVDRDNISQIQARFSALNAERLQQAMALLSERQAQCLALLPLLLHVNHPRLPGYLSKNTPAGLQNFQPGDKLLRMARSIGRGFRLGSQFLRRHQLQALYVMGSVGTVAQSQKSDMDFWLCIEPGLTDAERTALQKKCELICLWARELGLDWHIFVMDPQAFAAGQHGSLSEESSGSAQHFLLLDEFYRSTILLAGRMPLWWFVAARGRDNYQREKQRLIDTGFVRRSDWLDFGPVGDVPPAEFVSAAVWQLYKSISSPFKSLLKLLLLEVYLGRYPSVLTLADKTKLLVYAGSYSAAGLDPYLLLLEELTDYFSSRREYERLELMRQCFYFKVERRFCDLTDDDPLRQALLKWDWSDYDFAHLDKASQWNAQQVQQERGRVVRELTQSYRQLLALARQHCPDLKLNSTEITVLGRKLYAAFERAEGKIEFINPGLSLDIHAGFLLLERQTGSDQWQLYLTNARWEKTRQPLNQSGSLLQLLCWAWFNQILLTDSRVRIAGQDSYGEHQLREALNLLSGLNWLPLTEPDHQAFHQAARLRQCVLLVNDPALVRAQQVQSDSPETDPLNTAGRSLVAQLHILTHNSWGEIKLRNFGADLAAALSWLAEQDQPQLTVQVRCLQRARANLIEQRLSRLLANLQAHWRAGPGRLLLAANGGFLLCEQGAGCRYLDGPALWSRLAEPLALPQPLRLDPDSLARFDGELAALVPLAGLSERAGIQVLYQVQGAQASVYLRDERGSLIYFRQPFHDQRSLLKPLHHFIRAVLNRNPLDSARWLFGIVPVEFYELVSTARGLAAQPRLASSELASLKAYNLQFAVHALDPQAPPGRWQLSAWLEGEPLAAAGQHDLFSAVAQALMARRQSGQRYPVYLTDLDLEGCRSQLPHSGQLQTSHFIAIKLRLEAALNAALQAL